MERSRSVEVSVDTLVFVFTNKVLYSHMVAIGIIPADS